MQARTYPFTPESHVAGGDRQGRPVVLAPMTEVAADTLAPAIVAVGPWAHYGFLAAAMRTSLLATGDGAIRYEIRCGGDCAGAAAIRSPWLAGPYLQLLAILPEFRGCGVGKVVLDWYEATARSVGTRNLWLCVSGFNRDAQRLYRREGYHPATILPDLMRSGDDELLMRKLLADPSTDL